MVHVFFCHFHHFTVTAGLELHVFIGEIPFTYKHMKQYIIEHFIKFNLKCLNSVAF